MTPPRVAPLEPPYDADVAALLATMTPPDAPEPLALARVLAKNAALAARMAATGGHFLGLGSTLPVRDREIVIDRTCARCGAEYAWGVHVGAFARAAGLTDAEVRHTVSHPPDPDAWSEKDGALIALVDQLHDRATVDDALWAVLSSHYDEAQRIELLMLVGWYHAIAFVCNGARVPLERWQARLPKAL